MSTSVQIITDPDVALIDTYFISHLINIWRSNGLKVFVGSVEHLDADIGILHIDRTRVEGRYLPHNPGAVPLLNGRVTDISKRSFSRNILDRTSHYDGPVIIKTDENCFGIPERMQSGRNIGYSMRKLLACDLSWHLAKELPHTYPVLDHLEQVPQWVWQREDLVVEKFRPEKEGDFYILRQWLFLGDQEYGTKIWGRHPVVKSSNQYRHEYTNDIPEVLRDMRNKLHIDFGKFDYVVSENEVFLLDVNKTPTMGMQSSEPGENVLKVAQGIYSYA